MKNRWRILLLFVPILLVSLVAAGYLWLFPGLPSLDSLPDRLNPPSVRITDRFGRTLYEVLAEEGGRHSVVDLESIPPELRQATIATEDRDFYSHSGVDLRAILRALWIDIRASLQEAQIETPSGGSTITQQVARSLLFSEEERFERSLRRKIRESILAWQLTRNFTKDEILALYLNQTYYGGLAYGAEAASQTFFGKPVSQLDLAESALLAGLPQAPALYNPLIDPEAAQERQIVVLELMQKAGYINDEERALAEREKLIFASSPYPINAPHFVMMVRSHLDNLYTPDQIYELGGLVIRTTLNLDWQSHAERAVSRHLEELSRGEFGMGHNVNNAALVAMDPDTGEILALVGSPDYFDADSGGAINMTISPRQPGSALKPILYAAALDPSQEESSSPPWTAATMLLDVSTSFMTHDGKAYVPSNYDQLEHGPVLVREALGSSLNIPAVLTLDYVGMNRLFNQATKLGITTLKDPEQYDLSLALGGGEVRLLELTAAYGAFANGGYRVSPVSILDISDFQGNLLYTSTPASQVRVLDDRLVWLISDILSDNDARIIGFGEVSSLRLDRPAAVKTGTTSNFHDNWTIGYTPDLVTGVWVGNTDYEPMRDVNGLTGAAPIWHTFTRTVLTGQPEQEFFRPEGLVKVEVCALSGLLPTPECPYRRWEWFIEGTEPTQPDHFYHLVEIDIATGLIAGENTPIDRRTEQIVLNLPPQAQPWARMEGITLLSDLLAASHSTSDPGSQRSIQLISPARGSVYRLDPALDPEVQKLLIEAVGDGNFDEVTLWIDGELLGTYEREPYQAWWPLSLGEHEAWAEGLRADGESVVSARVIFVVEE
ncbi:MAG: penicillin-binding protein [Anaerolineales bacterium]|nr:penicillin-binding protein [Anaerolineales bacterium]